MTRKRETNPLSGVLLVDKEAGWTSHDVVARVRRLTRQRRIGHTGTLDPAATGLLVLCLGKATRLVEFMTASDKRYIGEIVLGVTTDTDDAEGEVLRQADPPDPGSIDLDELAAKFTGEILQRPPAYSAVKVAGQRAYSAARKGKALELAERPVTVYGLALAELGPGRLRIDLHCGPGTYVRSIARDIGEALGCGAHLASLRRTRSGAFTVAQAWTMAEIERICQDGKIERALRGMDEGLTGLSAAVVSEPHGTQLANGQQPLVRQASAHSPGLARVYTTAGDFIALARLDESGRLVARKVLG